MGLKIEKSIELSDLCNIYFFLFKKSQKTPFKNTLFRLAVFD